MEKNTIDSSKFLSEVQKNKNIPINLELKVADLFLALSNLIGN
jgi:hypothetical protein